MKERAVKLHTTCSECEVEAVFHGVAYFSKVKDQCGMITDHAVFDCRSCGAEFDVQKWTEYEAVGKDDWSLYDALRKGD